MTSRNVEQASGMTTARPDDVALTRVWDVMNRSTAPAVVDASILHFGREELDTTRPVSIENAPIGLDTNAIIRIGQQRKADVIDFLAARHKGPLILPGQAIQEVWNNFDGFTSSFAGELQKRLKALEDLLVQSDNASFSTELRAVQSSVAEFVVSHPRARVEQSYAHLESAFRMLGSRSKTFFVPRSDFYNLGELRFRSRTPPGFQDGGQLGDFYLWADFLYGLTLCVQDVGSPSTVVFITNEQKKDWIVDGRPHPVLRAEVRELVGGELEIWSLDRLDSYSSAEVDDPPSQ